MFLLYSDERGRFYEHNGFGAAGRSGDRYVEITPEDVIELPRGASLVLIPGGRPVGLDKTGNFALAQAVRPGGGTVWAMGALLPQGYTRTLLPAYSRREGSPLPLMGYAAVAWQGGKVFVAAQKTDNPRRWHPDNYNTPDLEGLVKRALKNFSGNRVIRQLAHCALDYSCYTAQNIFYRRWEGGLPVSPVCNANCLGCISLQPSQCCPSPQDRIDFRPSVTEVAEIMLNHLNGPGGAIISFGQGCEGEPLLAWKTIAAAVGEVRAATARGTININTNAGFTEGLKKVCMCGLDSIRVSIISAREDIYNSYYRPRDYFLQDVRRSVLLARSGGVHVSLNLLVFPGLTDRREEIKALQDLIVETGVNMVQLRNLNIDPDYLWRHIAPPRGEILGIARLINTLREIPGLKVGNFTHPVLTLQEGPAGGILTEH